ncbi:unnamed protein product [Umbelopsis vinacea]
MKLLLPFIAIPYLICTVSALVYSPKITKPDSSTKWRAGRSYTVTWDPNSAGVPIPDSIKYASGVGGLSLEVSFYALYANQFHSYDSGSMKLGYLLHNDKYNEHLYWNLGGSFQLNSGSQRITLPSDLETRNSYIIVLFGDSGNASPQFEIEAARHQ